MMSDWNIPQKYLDQTAEIERLRAANERLSKSLADMMADEDGYGGELTHLRAALERVLNYWPSDPDDYAAGVQAIAREALGNRGGL